MDPAVFLDKDGTLIEDVPYNVDPALVRLMPGARDALRLLHDAGFRLFVITNQSGVARGYFGEDDIAALGVHLTRMLTDWGTPLDGFYFCPHLPGGSVEAFAVECGCRKPEPGLILEAARLHHLDLARSWFLGDIASDIEAGRRSGCRTILVGPPAQVEPELLQGAAPDHIASDLREAARIVVNGPRPVTAAAERATVLEGVAG